MSRSDESFDDLLRAVARAPSIDPRALGSGDLAGKRLAHFRVDARLGAGGMGVVYRAEDEQLHRTVALKVLAARFAGEGARALLLGEARAAAAVMHPAIAAIYEVGEAEGVAYIAMEYVEGTTLRALLARGAIAEEAAIAHATAIASGLARAHTAGVVHRDLKPDNVMIGASGQVKILDFGLARTAFAPEEAGHVQGTLVYMSPEQARGERATAASDVFSFGVMLYEMLTAHLPFPRGVLARWPSQSPRARLVPRAIDRVVHRCLALDPAERYRDGAALMEALEAMRASRGRRMRAARIAGAVVIVGAVAASAYFASPRTRGPAALPLKRLTANVPEIPILDAALSPDGAELAFTDRTGLTVQRIGTPAARHVALPGGLAPELVAWFPRGDELLVTARAPNDEASTMWRVPLLGAIAAAPTRIAEGAFTGVRVSPDGKRAAFAETDRVAWLDLDAPALAHDVVKKTEGCFLSELAWSPDGARIAFVSLCFDTLSATAIETVDLAGAQRQKVVTDPRLFNDSARGGVLWTARNEIVYPLAEWLPAEAGSNLYAVAVDASGRAKGAPRAVTSWVGTSASALTSNVAGDRIAFVRFDLQADVFVGDLSEGGHRLSTPRRLTLTDRNERPSAWSADSKGVYFFSDRNGNFDVFFQEIAGGTAKTVLASDAWETLPQVMPNGGGLLYWRFPPVKAGESVRPDLVRAGLDGSAPSRVLTARAASHPSGAGRPQPWEMRVRCPRVGACVLSERDGDALVFREVDPDRGQDGEGAEVLRLAHANAAANLWDVSPDGTRIAIPVESGPVRIYARSRDGAAKVETEVDVAAGCDPLVPAWSAEGAQLFVSAECGSDQNFRLYVVSARAGVREAATLLWETPPSYILESEPSPDGAHLAIALKTADNDVWMVEMK